jgi:hypothetical protein
VSTSGACNNDRFHHWSWCRNNDAEVTCRTTSPRASCNIKVMMSQAICGLCTDLHTHIEHVCHIILWRLRPVPMFTGCKWRRLVTLLIILATNASSEKHTSKITTGSEQIENFQELYNIYAYLAKIPMCRRYHHLHLHQNQQRSKSS